MFSISRCVAAKGSSRLTRSAVKRKLAGKKLSQRSSSSSRATLKPKKPVASAAPAAAAPSRRNPDYKAEEEIEELRHLQRLRQQAAAAAGVAKPAATEGTHRAGIPIHHFHNKGAGKLVFDDSKAGLQKVDKDHVEQVIQDASQGSLFYQKEQLRAEARQKKAEKLLEKAQGYDQLSAEEKREIMARVDTLQHELESTRDLRRRFIHIDMDMFYAAVEEKKNPKLRGVPFGVGSNKMLSTTNYIARQYGVRSGMPGFIGKKLCPDMVIVPNDFPAYRREAARVHSIAARYDAKFVSVGLDELTMDVTKFLEEFPTVSASQIANDFRDEVFVKTHMTCSGGIGPTSVLAKIASNVNKPNGQHEIALLTRDDVIDYMKNIPLRKIPGIGYAQELSLNVLGINTCGDLLKNKYLLAYLFKERTFTHYLEVGLGLAETFSQRRHTERQSVGKEVSFSEPLASEEALTKLFRKLLVECHVRCVREHLRPMQIRLVTKLHNYDTMQYSIGLPSPTNDLKVWLEASHKLLAPHLSRFADYRLIGVRLQKIVTGEEEGEMTTAGDDDHVDGHMEMQDRAGESSKAAAARYQALENALDEDEDGVRDTEEENSMKEEEEEEEEDAAPPPPRQKVKSYSEVPRPAMIYTSKPPPPADDFDDEFPDIQLDDIRREVGDVAPPSPAKHVAAPPRKVPLAKKKIKLSASRRR